MVERETVGFGSVDSVSVEVISQNEVTRNELSEEHVPGATASTEQANEPSVTPTGSTLFNSQSLFSIYPGPTSSLAGREELSGRKKGPGFHRNDSRDDSGEVATTASARKAKGSVRSAAALSDGAVSTGSAETKSEELKFSDKFSADPKDLWRGVAEEILKRIDAEVFSAWINPLEIDGFLPSIRKEDGSYYLAVSVVAPNKFSADHIRSAYGDVIREAAGAFFGFQEVELQISVQRPLTGRPLTGRVSGKGSPDSRSVGVAQSGAGSASTSSSNGAVSNRAGGGVDLSMSAARRTRPRGADQSQLNPLYNFSNFVIGNCNQFAHAVSLQVSEHPGAKYNPLFIYGGVGLGKTHLVNAIGNAARRRGKNVLMVSSEAFVNELIAALRANRMQQFKSRFRSLDLLIIDDVQFIIGKERTQEEFFHTFNELYQQNKQIILTSDKLPQELVGLEDRLRTRFASGLSADLQAPDFETRVAILTKKAEALGLILPEDVAQLLSERVDTNVRELEGALNRLMAMSSIRNAPITRAFAEEAFHDFRPVRKNDISAEFVQKIIAERYSVSVSDILGKRRTQNIAFARQVAMYLTRKLTPCSFPEIGAFFGGRDHSTVIHAVKVIEERAQKSPVFKKELDSLNRKITG